MALTTSEFPMTKAPPIVAGEVEPILGIAIKPTGTPASAYAIAPSIPCLSCPRGAMVQTRQERGGCF